MNKIEICVCHAPPCVRVLRWYRGDNSHRQNRTCKISFYIFESIRRIYYKQRSICWVALFGRMYNCIKHTQYKTINLLFSRFQCLRRRPHHAASSSSWHMAAKSYRYWPVPNASCHSSSSSSSSSHRLAYLLFYLISYYWIDVLVHA